MLPIRFQLPVRNQNLYFVYSLNHYLLILHLYLQHISDKSYIWFSSLVLNLFLSSLRSGGNIYYIGDDSLAIMGLIDASECPPTYGASKSDIWFKHIY
jgi:hypothetical protein